MIIIGVDPGLSGAIATLEVESGNEVKQVRVFDFPTVKVKRGKGNKNEYQVAFMASMIDGWVPKGDGFVNAIAVIENVTPMPSKVTGQKQGATSAFTSGRGLGILEGIFSALRIPYTKVTAAKWKKAMGLQGKDKDDSRLMAQQLFPALASDLVLKKHHGRAEAVLIAEFYRRQQGFKGE